jgi:flagellar biosynthesis chaperone FliJ
MYQIHKIILFFIISHSVFSGDYCFDDLPGNVEAFIREIVGKNDEITRQYADQNAQHQREVNSLNILIDRYVTDINALQHDHTQVTNENIDLQRQIHTLEASLAESATQLTMQRNYVDEGDKAHLDLDELRIRFTELEDLQAHLHNQFNSERRDLLKRIECFRLTIEALKSERDNVNADNFNLIQHIKELKYQIATLEQRLSMPQPMPRSQSAPRVPILHLSRVNSAIDATSSRPSSSRLFNLGGRSSRQEAERQENPLSARPRWHHRRARTPDDETPRSPLYLSPRQEVTSARQTCDSLTTQLELVTAEREAAVTERDARPTQEHLATANAARDAAIAARDTANTAAATLTAQNQALIAELNTRPTVAQMDAAHAARDAAIAARDAATTAATTLTIQNQVLIAELNTRPTVAQMDAAHAACNVLILERDARPTQQQLAIAIAERDASNTTAATLNAQNQVLIAELNTRPTVDQMDAAHAARDTAIAERDASNATVATLNAQYNELTIQNQALIAELNTRPTVAQMDAAHAACNVLILERDARPTQQQLAIAIAERDASNTTAATLNAQYNELTIQNQALIAELNTRPTVAQMDAAHVARDTSLDARDAAMTERDLANAQITVLQTQLSELNTIIGNLTAERNAANSARDTAAHEHTNIFNHNNQLQNLVIALQIEIHQLKTQINQLNDELTRARTPSTIIPKYTGRLD